MPLSTRFLGFSAQLSVDLSAIGDEASTESQLIHSSFPMSVRPAPNRRTSHATPLLWQGHPGEDLLAMSSSMHTNRHKVSDKDVSLESTHLSAECAPRELLSLRL